MALVLSGLILKVALIAIKWRNVHLLAPKPGVEFVER